MMRRRSPFLEGGFSSVVLQICVVELEEELPVRYVGVKAEACRFSKEHRRDETRSFIFSVVWISFDLMSWYGATVVGCAFFVLVQLGTLNNDWIVFTTTRLKYI